MPHSYCHISLQWRHNEYDGVSITGVTIVYSTVGSGADQRKHQSSASLVFVKGIHRWPVNSPHKGPVTRKMFLFDDVIMWFSHLTMSIGAESELEAPSREPAKIQERVCKDDDKIQGESPRKQWYIKIHMIAHISWKETCNSVFIFVVG